MSSETARLSGKGNLKKILSWGFKLGLGAVAIYLILQKVEIGKVGGYLRDTHWGWLFPAFAAFLTSKIIAAYRINHFYRSQGLQLDDQRNVKLGLLSMFYNLFVPLVGGEGYRIYWLRQRFETPTKQLIWASLLDRVSGLAALLTLAIISFPFTSFELAYKPLSLLLIPVMYVTYWLVSRWLFPSFQSAWTRAALLSIIVQFLQVVCTYCILLALNVETQILDYLFVFLLSCLAFVLPFLGAREMAFVFGADFLGLNPDLSLTISLLFYLALALTSLIGLYFLFTKIDFPKKNAPTQ